MNLTDYTPLSAYELANGELVVHFAPNQGTLCDFVRFFYGFSPSASQVKVMQEVGITPEVMKAFVTDKR